MDSYKESDTVQDLFQEIEDLIDNKKTSADDEYSFERPILIESDSDELEEIIEPALSMHTLSTCHKCNRPIASGDSLQVSLCANCEGPKKRARSRSFTFDIGQFADKVKQSLQLPPSSGRRKSMPSMNEAYLEPPGGSRPNSRPSSRPSSRASSFIEDVKQFLAPLSRKSSRNSLFQDFQREERELQKKSSHSSLLDALNPYKPKKQYSYERRVIYQENDNPEEENEIIVLNSQQIPVLKRKELKKIEPRQERMDIYENAYFQCMKTQTGLMSWITKQAQKGPPDAWFGYTPPPKEPKKFLGIFKRKIKTNDLRQQQLQLSDDLLNRLSSLNTPLCLSEDPRTTEEEEEEEYEQDSYDTEVTSSPSTMDIPIPQQPVSILKKTNSSRNMYDTYDYEDDYEDYMPPVEARYPKRGHRNYQPREDYFEYAEPIQQRSSQIRKTYYPSEYEARSKRRVSDMNDEDYYYSRRNSYYAFKPKKPTLEEWEMTLDDLCDLFPRLDRFFIDEFLVSAQGNFDIAKDRIMNMLMEIR